MVCDIWRVVLVLSLDVIKKQHGSSLLYAFTNTIGLVIIVVVYIKISKMSPSAIKLLVELVV